MRYFKALLLTEGAHGMVSQVEGLAKALKLDFNHCFVNLKRPWRYFPINLVHEVIDVCLTNKCLFNFNKTKE